MVPEVYRDSVRDYVVYKISLPLSLFSLQVAPEVYRDSVRDYVVYKIRVADDTGEWTVSRRCGGCSCSCRGWCARVSRAVAVVGGVQEVWGL